MYRTDVPSAVAVRPAPTALGTEGWFRNADVGGGVQGTVVDADFLNMVQAELEAMRAVGVPDGIADPGATKTTTPQLAAIFQAWMNARINALFPMAYPPGFIQGFRRSVPDLSANDSLVDFHPGRARANGGAGNIDRPSGVMRKDIGANWAAGDGMGGWPSGLAAPSTYDWVFAMVIQKPDGTVDFGWDTDGAATNLLADATGYTLSRIIGIDEPMPGDVVRSFYQYPGHLDYVEWARPVQVGLADHPVDTYTAGTTLATGAPPGTTARMAISHTFPQYGVDFGTFMKARYYPAEDATYDETVDASSWTIKVPYTGQVGFIENGALGESLIIDVYGGGAASFRAKYADVPATMLGHFNCLGYTWDRLREAV